MISAALAPLLALLLVVLSLWRRRSLSLHSAECSAAQGSSVKSESGTASPQQTRTDDAAAAKVFAQQYPGYGYDGKLKAMQCDFAHLPRDEVYLDHAGATLCSASQVRSHADAILASTLGNPHSRNKAGQRTALVMRRTRELVLQHVNANERDYAVVFTSGCTGALQMLAQHFRWTPGKSVLGYSLCNHNSVLGMREIAKQHLCPFACLPPALISELLNRQGGADCELRDDDAASGCGEQGQGDEADNMLDTPRTGGWESTRSDGEGWNDAAAHLFAFSPECNFSGTKTDMSLVSLVQQGCLDAHIDTYLGGGGGEQGWGGEGGKWYVLVDAAKAAATGELNLSGAHRPDFVSLSFYKMMGLPTGLGALLIRRDAATQLDKRSFAGGSVLAVQPEQDFFKLRDSISERYEDGSPSFLSILAAAQGLEMLRSIGLKSISTHTWSLRDYLSHELMRLHHANTKPLVELYGAPPGTGSQFVGSICTFNLRRPDGRYIEYTQVEELAGLNGLALRTGSFCNPGATHHYLNLSRADVERFFAQGKVCGDDRCIIDGKSTGAIRVSFGYMSTRCDADALVEFVVRYFLNKCSSDLPAAVCTAAATPVCDAAASVAVHKSTGMLGHASSRSTICLQQKGMHHLNVAAAASSAEAVTHTHSHPLAHPRPDKEDQRATRRGEDVKTRAHTYSHAERDKAPLPAYSGTVQDVGNGGNGTEAEGGLVEGEVQEVYVYPIKSCGAHECGSWPLTAKGLLYDRLWTLVDVEGSALTQKNEPGLARIRPTLLRGAAQGGGDLLRVTCSGREDLGCVEIAADGLPVEEGDAGGGSHGGTIRGFLAACGLEVRSDSAHTSVRVCGRQGSGIAYGSSVNRWFTSALGRECVLIRQSGAKENGAAGGKGKGSVPGTPPDGPLSSSASSTSTSSAAVVGLAGSNGTDGKEKGDGIASYHSNGGQLLMVTEESIAALWRRLRLSRHCDSDCSAVAALGGSLGRSAGGSVGTRRSICGDWLEARAELIMRLRPNLVVRRCSHALCISSSAIVSHAEEGWEDSVTGVSFHSSPVAMPLAAAAVVQGAKGGGADVGRGRGEGMGVTRAKGPCFRCGMVNVDQVSGDVSVEPLLTLSSYRRDPERGRVTFGVLLDVVSLSAHSAATPFVPPTAAAHSPSALPTAIASSLGVVNSDVSVTGRSNVASAVSFAVSCAPEVAPAVDVRTAPTSVYVGPGSYLHATQRV